MRSVQPCEKEWRQRAAANLSVTTNSPCFIAATADESSLHPIGATRSRRYLQIHCQRQSLRPNHLSSRNGNQRKQSRQRLKLEKEPIVRFELKGRKDARAQDA